MAFGRLRANVWERNGIKLDTKLKVYNAVVLPTLLYACDLDSIQRQQRDLTISTLVVLRKLLKIKWQDNIPDIKVLKKAGTQSMHATLKLAQLRWTGHVIRMPDEQLPFRKSSVENYRRERAFKVARSNATKTPSKPL